MQTTANRTARLVGSLHLSLLPLGVFSFVYVPSALIVRGDAAATAANILASESLFRAGAIGHLISQVIVVFLMLAWYRLTRPINQEYARAIVVLGLLGIPISFVAEAHQLLLLDRLAAGDMTTVPIALDTHRTLVLAAQVFWGLWLAVAATLILQSRLLPAMVGLLVLVGAAGYLFDSFAHFAGANVPTVSPFTALGELSLPLWLLLKGVTPPAPKAP